MKVFFKKNWLIILFLIVGLTLFLCGNFLAILSPIGLILLGISFLLCALKKRKKYKEFENYDIEDDYVDARKFGYDEDVYYVGTISPNKIQKKNSLNKFSNVLPVVIWGILSGSCILLGISTFIKILL